MKQDVRMELASLSELRQMAKDGSAEAMFQMGVCYHRGRRGAHISFLEAASWYMKAARKGNRLAMQAIGNCYLLGEGVLQNLQMAEKWFLHAELGSGYYNNCLEDIPQRKERLQSILKWANDRAVAESGEPDGERSMANYYNDFGEVGACCDSIEFAYWTSTYARKLLADHSLDAELSFVGVVSSISVRFYDRFALSS